DQPGRLLAHLAHERHAIAARLAFDDEPRLHELGMAAHDLVHLRRRDEHRAHLRALIGAAHPTLDAHVRAPAWARAREHGGKVAGAEANERVILVEGGNDDLAYFARRHGVAGSRPH